jgi:hypothetical protein
MSKEDSMRLRHISNRFGILFLLAWMSGFAGITYSQAADPVPVPPPPLVKTTVMPGTVDLDKVYKGEKNKNKKQRLKDNDRQKYGLAGGDAGSTDKGHGKNKQAKAN